MIHVTNWRPYRGDVSLVLEPKPYAIVARRDDDPDSSNWAGKTALVEAIDFALWGRLQKAGMRRKVDWITRGENEGKVKLVFSDGSRIIRSQTVASSEKLRFWRGMEENEQARDAAQQGIERLVGLTKDDYAATCFARQREMARLVTCDPSERMELVAGWIRLAPVEACEDRASADLSAASAEQSRLSARGIDLKNKIDAALEGRTIEQMTEQFEALKVAEAEARARMDLARANEQKEAVRRALEPDARRYEVVVRQGKELASSARQMTPVHQDDVNASTAVVREAMQQHAIANEKVRVLAPLAAGTFDGTCPLVGTACPARAFVVGAKERHVASLRIASDLSNAAQQRMEESMKRESALREADAQARRVAQRLDDLRTEARRLKPAYVAYRPGDGDAATLAFADATNAHQEAHDACFRAEVQLSHAKLDLEEMEKLDRAIASLGETIRTLSNAVSIFGKNGAQRRIAEGAVSEIEGRANETFAASGIELSVRLSWSREGSGPATNCGQCGAAFPTSARVKSCAACGAERGKQLVNRLEVELSDRSGAAEDLAGMTLQLSAADWLRADRASDWGVAVLDEPTAALDAANRKAFAAALPRVLLAARFPQAFVIAHHVGILDSLPGRILITSKDGFATAKVVA